MDDAVFILAPERSDVIARQWEVCLCVQLSIKLPVKKLVFNRAVRDGTRT